VRVIEDGVAAEVTKILGENIRYGTATAAELGRPDAAKTGTTENHADAWLCGYTPNLSTTVWMGFPQAEVPMTSVHGISVTGGSFPAQIWHLYMRAALSHRVYEFPKAKAPPEYKPFTRGDDAIPGGYVLTDTSTTSTATGTRPTKTRPGATTQEIVPTTPATTPAVTTPAVTETTPGVTTTETTPPP
jgi:penicillin-binding protein 1A